MLETVFFNSFLITQCPMDPRLLCVMLRLANRMEAAAVLLICVVRQDMGGIIARQIQIYWVCNLVISRHWGKERNILHIPEFPDILFICFIFSSQTVCQSVWQIFNGLVISSSSSQSNPTHNCRSDWRQIIKLFIFISQIVNVCSIDFYRKSYLQTNRIITVCEGKLAEEAM